MNILRMKIHHAQKCWQDPDELEELLVSLFGTCLGTFSMDQKSANRVISFYIFSLVVQQAAFFRGGLQIACKHPESLKAEISEEGCL